MASPVVCPSPARALLAVTARPDCYGPGPGHTQASLSSSLSITMIELGSLESLARPGPRPAAVAVTVPVSSYSAA